MLQETLSTLTKTLLVATLLSGCAIFKETEEPDEYAQTQAGGPRSKVFVNSYDKVWKASQIAIAQYPLKSYDVDSGTIETEYIGGENVWLPPHQSDFKSGGFRYKINLKVLKGKKDKKEAVRVIVLKQVETKSDFFSNFEKLTSDGLEEIAILYRISRELEFN